MNSTTMWIVVGVAVLAIIGAIIYAVTRNNSDSRGVGAQRGTGEEFGTQRRTPTTTPMPTPARTDVEEHPSASTDHVEQPREDELRRAGRRDDDSEQRRRGRRSGNSRD